MPRSCPMERTKEFVVPLSWLEQATDDGEDKEARFDQPTETERFLWSLGSRRPPEA